MKHARFIWYNKNVAREKKPKEKLRTLQREIVITRDQLIGMIEVIDSLKGNAITIDLLEFQEQVRLFEIPSDNPQ